VSIVNWDYFTYIPFSFKSIGIKDRGFFPKAPYPLKQHFPGSLTRNLYRKKIPEIVKIVDIVPKDGEDKTSEVVTGMYRKGRNVLHCEMQCQDRKSLPDYDGWCSTFRAPWAPFMVFPESPTRKLYRKKIPEIVKMVPMVPKV
jgi:hypothetical protein